MENLHTIENVFTQRLFHVPDYQRGYAWEETHLQDFVEDLELLEAGRQHFMGTLILHAQDGSEAKRMDRSGNSYVNFDIVDGQQRLTTIAILLDVLVGKLTEIGGYEHLATGIREKYLATQDTIGRPLPKLTLNSDCNDYFQAVILDLENSIAGPTIRSHELLQSAKSYFQGQLTGQQQKLDGAFGPWLQELFSKLVSRLTLMVYTVEREADAGVLFETMNNRGKSITELEKTKNYLLYLAGKLQLQGDHDLVVRTNKTWKHIFERLMAAGLGSTYNEDQLLRAHWLMAYRAQPQEWSGSRSIKAHFNLRDYQGKHEQLLDDLHAYLTSLQDAATAYCDIYRPASDGAFGNWAQHPRANELDKEAQRLARVGSLASFVPLLMAQRIRYKDDVDDYIQLTRLCEKYAFRVYRLLRLRSNAGQTGLFSLGHQLYTGRIAPAAARQRVERTILEYSPDRTVSALLEDREWNWYNWAGIRYFLYEYEHYLADERKLPVKVLWEEVAAKPDSIEHILPRTPDAGGYWIARFPGETYATRLHDIGNLSLTYDNSSLGNKPFRSALGDDKVTIYAKSPFQMELALTDYENWTPEAVSDRGAVLRSWARERWYVEPPPEPPMGDRPAPADFRLLFSRRSIPFGQQLLYRELYAAGDGGLTSNELVNRMARKDRSDLSGVLGALGNRVNRTPGFGASRKPGIGMLMTIESLPDGQYRYVLKPQMREALEELDSPWLRPPANSEENA